VIVVAGLVYGAALVLAAILFGYILGAADAPPVEVAAVSKATTIGTSAKRHRSARPGPTYVGAAVARP
jgi:hypothetical protein